MSTTSIERQRRHRARKRADKRVLSIEVDAEFVVRLVKWGWIGVEEVKSPTVLGDVIQDIAECKQRGLFREGPIVVTGTSTGS